jgi:hypothetical protein
MDEPPTLVHLSGLLARDILVADYAAALDRRHAVEAAERSSGVDSPRRGAKDIL